MMSCVFAIVSVFTYMGFVSVFEEEVKMKSFSFLNSLGKIV